MATMPPTFRPRGQVAKVERDREYDQRRGSARERGYTTAWDKAAAGHLRHEPLCRYCAMTDVVTPATLVDHFYPHGGDQWLFWLKPYWVSSCGTCHSGWKQRLERKGLMALDDVALVLGLPLLSSMVRPAAA